MVTPDRPSPGSNLFLTRWFPLSDYVGYIVLFSNIESGIGCVATSLPSIRKLYKRRLQHEASEDTTHDDTPKVKSLVTIGGGSGSGSGFSRGRKAKNAFTNPTDRGVSRATVQAKGGNDGDWERLHDGDSDEIPLSPFREGNSSTPVRGIRADYTYSVELEPVKRNEPQDV